LGNLVWFLYYIYCTKKSIKIPKGYVLLDCTCGTDWNQVSQNPGKKQNLKITGLVHGASATICPAGYSIIHMSENPCFGDIRCDCSDSLFNVTGYVTRM